MNSVFSFNNQKTSLAPFTPILFLIPLTFLILSLIMREHAGPFWLWSNLDPDYAYLIDSLNLLNTNWPKLVVHPGTTVNLISALVIKLAHPLTYPKEITDMVLLNSEHYLRLIGYTFITLNTIMLIIIGIVGLSVFSSLTPALFLQTGPFLSKLVFKWSIHVAPEPLLITAITALSCLSILALKDRHLEKYRNRYIISFAMISGFGIATKITSAGLFILPLFILWSFQSNIKYCFASIIFILIFTLPAAGSYDMILEQITLISSATGHHGFGEKGFVDLASYPRNIIRMASRPIFFVVLIVGIILIIRFKLKFGTLNSSVTCRTLLGLCCAFICQVTIVAKHPAGHYMIPALVASPLGIVLIFQLSKELVSSSSSWQIRLNKTLFLLLILITGFQGRALFQLDKQFTKRSVAIKNFNHRAYQNCARIFFWPASNIQYGLFFGSWNTNHSFSTKLAKLFPDKSVMYLIGDGKLHGLNTIYQIKSVQNKFPCIYAQGEHSDKVLATLNDAFSAYLYKERCKVGAETILTWGISCKVEND